MRQAQQEEDDNLRHQLDAELDGLRSLLYASDLSTIQKPAAEKAKGDDRPASVPLSSALQEKPQDQEYDQFVRELAFEARAKPKDRTKTEDELAMEEKEALEKAERKRLRRMRGEAEDTDDEEEGSRKGKKRQRGGDDLDDDFVDEEGDYPGILGAGLGAESANEEGSEEEEDSEEEEGSEVEGEEEDEDGDLGDEGEEDGVLSVDDMPDSEAEDAGEEGDEEELVKVKKSRNAKKTSSSRKKELPYTFPCPGTHDEFLEIVEDIDDADVPTVVKRIRTLHHPSLAGDNKFKLQVCAHACTLRCY